MLARVDNAESDTGPRASGVTERLCIVTRQVRPIDELIRFVAGPDGALVADLKRRLPGRGVWVVAERTRLAEAVKRGAFQKSLRTGVRVPLDLPAAIDALLEKSALDALAIARKASQIVAGFTKVESAVLDGSAIALLHATEAAADGARKIAAAGRRAQGARADQGVKGIQRAPGTQGGVTPEITRIFAFTSAQLDLALGRPNVIHAALLAGRAGETFLARWRTLERYRAGDPGDRNEGAANPRGPGLGSND
jgi:uncharacterized protein